MREGAPLSLPLSHTHFQRRVREEAPRSLSHTFSEKVREGAPLSLSHTHPALSSLSDYKLCEEAAPFSLSLSLSHTLFQRRVREEAPRSLSHTFSEKVKEGAPLSLTHTPRSLLAL